jgi:hypothetical protein
MKADHQYIRTSPACIAASAKAGIRRFMKQSSFLLMVVFAKFVVILLERDIPFLP